MARVDRERMILHLDMDAFFASVEVLRRPDLSGRPVVVGGEGPRGVVAAASYEARAYGVFSAMPSVRARRLCPDAVFLHGDHAHYARISARIMQTLRQVTPLVEPLSLDEAFCDVTGAVGDHAGVAELADELKGRILAAEDLHCAVGVGPSKLVAKLASKEAKPRVGSPQQPVQPGPGVVVVPEIDQLSFIHPMPVTAMWGVGRVTSGVLAGLGIATIGDLAAFPAGVLERKLGRSVGSQLVALANGIDDRPVQPDRAPRSVGHEETYTTDITGMSRLHTEVLRLADATATRLSSQRLECRTVQIKVRFADFSTITRSSSTDRPTASARNIAARAHDLLDTVDCTVGVRLLGVTATGLVAAGGDRQLTFDDLEAPSWDETERTVGAIRDRFGPDAIAPASLVSDGKVEIRRRGDQQWGKPARRR